MAPAETKIHQSTVVQIGDLAYHVKQPAVLLLPETSSSQLRPAVVIDLPATLSSLGDYIEDKLKSFEALDDVYNPIFAESGNFIFQHSKQQSSDLNKATDAISRLYGTSNVAFHHVADGFRLPEGPYFLSGNAVYQAWRLYADDLRAFVIATVPVGHLGVHASYTFEPLLATSIYGDELAVAVPSRLYSLPTADLPLNGKRITIKDNIHLAGVKTSMGNRAYVDYYGPQEETAAYVKLLIDKGAVIIGKTKMSALAGSEKPPNQAIDYFPPWNPRADGYQRPGASSSGAGVCTAGYDWCDYAIGTDTTGSGRDPARVTGTWCLRLTTRILPTAGLVPSAEDCDSFALLTRSFEELHELTNVSTNRKLSETLVVLLSP